VSLPHPHVRVVCCKQSASLTCWSSRSQEGDFTVLGIETSCDDTAAAVVHSNGTILGESKRTQDELHAKWGGVVPGLARDAHQEAIEQVVEEALGNAALEPRDVDAVAVTMGPGLEICLRVGFRKARDIALSFERPFVSVHHLEAHVLTVRQSDPSIRFPFLVLLVSGGHCQLLVAVAVGEYKMLGGTLDDSLGEAYDKSARMLGLDVGGGGGQVLEALAKSGDPLAVKFGVPMKNRPVWRAARVVGLLSAQAWWAVEMEAGSRRELPCRNVRGGICPRSPARPLARALCLFPY